MKLEVKDLNKSFGKKQVIKDTSFVIENGVYGLLGPNGAGKTTLIRILSGVMTADSGEIIVNDHKQKSSNKSYVSKIGYLVDQVNLTYDIHRKCIKYSGGIKKRLGIAQALLNDPEILILDEPTAGLDPYERIKFRNIISSFSKDRTVILSTHIVSDIASISKRSFY